MNTKQPSTSSNNYGSQLLTSGSHPGSSRSNSTMSYQPQNVQFDHYYGRGSKRLSESQNLYSHPTELIETHLLVPYQQPTLVSSMQQQHYFPSTPTSYVHGTQSVASKTRPSIPNSSHSWFPPNQSDILGPSYSQSQSTIKPNYTSIQMQPVLDPMTSAVAGSKILGQSQGMPVNSHQKIQRENVLGRWPSDKTLVSGDMTGGGLAMSQGQHNAAFHSNTLTNVGANYFKQHHPQTYQQQQQQLLLQHIAQAKLIHQHQQQHQNQHQQLPLDSEYSIGNSSSHSITNPYNYPSQATYQNMERNILEGQQWQQYDMNSKFNNSAQQHYLNLQHQVRHQLQTPSSQQYSLNAQQKSNTQLFHQHQTRSFSRPPNYSDVNLFQQSDILQQTQNQGQYDPTYSDILDGGCNDHILYSTSSHVPHRTSSLSYSNLYGSLDQQTLPKPLSHTLYSARDVQDAELQANETLSHSSALKLAQAPDLPPTLPEFSKFIHHMLVVILKKVPAGDASLKRLDTELSLYIENVLQTTEVTRTTALLALKYVYMLSLRPGFRFEPGTEKNVIIFGLMLSNKILDDHTFTNRTWSDVSKLSLEDLNRYEIHFLNLLNHNNFIVPRDEFSSWVIALQKYWTQQKGIPIPTPPNYMMNTHINSSSASMASYTTNSYPFARRHFSTTETVTDPTKAMPPPPRYNSASSARTGSLAAASAAEAFDMMRTAPQHNMHTLPRDSNVQNNNSTSSNNQQQNLLYTLNQMKSPDTHQRKSSTTMDFQLNHHHHQRSSSTLPNTIEQPHLQNNPQYHRSQQTQSLPLLNFPVTDDTDAVSDATITALSTPYQEDRSDILGGGMMARSGLEGASSDHSSSCLGCLECLRGMQNTLYQGNMLYSGQAGVSYYQGSQPHGVGWEA